MSIFLPSICLSDDINQTKRYMILLRMSFNIFRHRVFAGTQKTEERHTESDQQSGPSTTVFSL